MAKANPANAVRIGHQEFGIRLPAIAVFCLKDELVSLTLDAAVARMAPP